MPKTINLKDLYPIRDVLMSQSVPIPTHLLNKYIPHFEMSWRKDSQKLVFVIRQVSNIVELQLCDGHRDDSGLLFYLNHTAERDNVEMFYDCRGSGITMIIHDPKANIRSWYKELLDLVLLFVEEDCTNMMHQNVMELRSPCFHARLSQLKGDNTFLQQTVEIKVMGEQTLWGALLGRHGDGYVLPRARLPRS